MNPLRKAWCRVFQTTFRVVLPLLPYRDPEVSYHIADIPAILESEGLANPLVVTDKSIRGLGLTRELEELLAGTADAAGSADGERTQSPTDGERTPAPSADAHPVAHDPAPSAVAVYDGVAPNPTTAMVEEALTLYREHGCDCLIAFGGGSPMDCAKAVGARLARPRKTLCQMAGILKVRHKTPVIIAIPTTAGTGSETTLAAVVVDHETHDKFAINDFPLIPRHAVLDASVIRTLPRHIAATTGMDALTHAIEAFIGRSTTRDTRSDALDAARLIFANIVAASDHTSREAESNMLMASHLAGRAFSKSYVGYVHAVSHSLSGWYDMPHGLVNAVILPHVLDMYGAPAWPKLAAMARYVGICAPDASDTDEARAKALIQAIWDLNAQLGIPERIEGIDPADIDAMAAHADREANPLYPVPVLWDADELRRVYERVSA